MVKSNDMDTTETQAVPAPPSLVKSLMAGFDAISAHVSLILFGFSLDLLLWLGPHLKVARLFQGILDRAAALPEMQNADMAQVMRSNQDLLAAVLARFNLLSLLRTLPVGIPSLMSGRAPLAAPTGQPVAWEVPSAGLAFLIWLAVIAVGTGAGVLYFSAVAQAALGGRLSWPRLVAGWPWAVLQVAGLALFWVILLLIFSFPFLCMLTVLSLSGVALSSFVLLVYGGLLAWFLLPLAFSPHGIFVYRRSLWGSVRDSVRLTRLTFPQTGLFLLSILVLSEGLDVLWEIPAESSWFAAVGMAGHAFITTGLLAASFIYYRDANQWVQRILLQARLANKG